MWQGARGGNGRGNRPAGRGRGSQRLVADRSADRSGYVTNRRYDRQDGRHDRSRDNSRDNGRDNRRDSSYADRDRRREDGGDSDRRWRSESRYGDTRRRNDSDNNSARRSPSRRRSDNARTGQGPESSKRKLSQQEAAVKRLKDYPQLEKAGNNIKLGGDKQPGIIQVQENKNNVPQLIKDIRAERSAVIFPRDIKKHPEFDQLANWAIDMSFKGVRCFSCRILNSDHRLAKNNLIFCADQYFPACLGNKAECIPVIRIEDGTFQAIKIALLCQKACGFKPEKGSVFAIGLTSYLCKVGAELYWAEFEKFSQWLEREMGGIAVPFLCPWSKHLPDLAHLNIHRGLTTFRAMYLGDLAGPQDWRFSLWLPLWEFLEPLSESGKHTVPPVLVKTSQGGNKVVECESELFMGVPGEFKNVVPICHQKSYIPALINHLRKVTPPSKNITVPPKHSILLGLKEAGLEPVGQGGKIPMLYLYGNSIIRDAGPPLADLLDVLVKDYDAVMTYSGKRIATILDEVPIPPQAHENDTVLIHCLGNVSLNESKYYQEKGVWHYKFPETLPEHIVHELVELIVQLQAKVRKVFKGHIKILGPFPRILNKCCNDKEHELKIRGPFKSVLGYFLALNHYLAIHPKLILYNVEFIPVQEIFPSFDESYLCDNIHLTEDRNKEFAEFLHGIIKRPRSSYELLPVDHQGFFTWVAQGGDKTGLTHIPPPSDGAGEAMDQTDHATNNKAGGSATGNRHLSTDSGVGGDNSTC